MTERRGFLRLVTLFLAALLSVGIGVAVGPSAFADDPSKHASVGPPDPIPKDWAGEMVGVDTNGKYCILQEADNCSLSPGQLPGTIDPCAEGYGDGCSDDAVKAKQLELLKKWEDGYDQNLSNFKPLDEALHKCIEKDSGTFQDCMNQNGGKYPPPVNGPLDWVAGKISKLASDALKEAASQIGESVVWLLKQFAEAFNSVSTINLAQTGIGQVVGLMTVVSVLLAAFLMLIQFGKLAVSQSGGPAATVITGLGKWAFILGCYAFATQVALNWSDSLSTWIINYSFQGGGSGTDDATKAMQQQLGTLFSGLVGGSSVGAGGAALVTGGGVLSQAVGVVIVLGILAILAIGALWVEMLVRQAGIMILVATMPVVLAGQLSDSTKDWWPKARNALVTLVLMKPVIVICFAIGFSAMAHADGIRNVIVGLIIFIMSAAAWPVVGRFLVFTSAGSGNGVGSAVLASVGSGIGAMFGGAAGAAVGAGAVGGGSGYTRALEGENEGAADSGGGRGFWSKTLKGSGSFGGGVAAGVGLGLQAAAAGVGMVEGAMGNAAAHAGLGSPAHGGGTVVPPRRARDSASGSSPASSDSGQDSGANPQTPAPNSGPATGGTAEASAPSPRPAAGPAATVEQPPPAAAAPAPPAGPTQNGPIKLGPVKPPKGEGDK